ncbi:MAG TPA: hypothetical protein PLV25_06410, partial [Opitutales bacterium]|nr:hypothetical protein [Opitutales bacterium]
CDLEDCLEKQMQQFCATLGLSLADLKSFATDYIESQDPDFFTVLLVINWRRAYFLEQQQSQPQVQRIAPSTIPDAQQELGGVVGLARISAKTSAWLKGELPTPLRFLDNEDRNFFKRIDLHPADFIRWIWDTQGEPQILCARIAWHIRRMHISP